MADGKERDLALVNQALALLGENFDSVQVFCTRHEGSEGCTVNVVKGVGNWYARRGQVADWLVKENEGSREEFREGNV